MRGSLDRASGSITILLLVTGALWFCHAIGLIDGLFPTPKPPEYVLNSVARIENPEFGATGIMVDRFHFLTTFNGVAGAGGALKTNDQVSVNFPDAQGDFEQPVAGSVSWISDDLSGFRLVLVKMQEERFDFSEISNQLLEDGQRVICLGFSAGDDGTDRLNLIARKRVLIDSGVATIDWGDEDQPIYEGFAILSPDDFRLQGLLADGIIVVPVPLDALDEAGVEGVFATP